MSKIANGGLTPVWHRMLYSCTHMATVGVNGLSFMFVFDVSLFADTTINTASKYISLLLNNYPETVSKMSNFYGGQFAVVSPSVSILSRTPPRRGLHVQYYCDH